MTENQGPPDLTELAARLEALEQKALNDQQELAVLKRERDSLKEQLTLASKRRKPMMNDAEAESFANRFRQSFAAPAPEGKYQFLLTTAPANKEDGKGKRLAWKGRPMLFSCDTQDVQEMLSLYRARYGTSHDIYNTLVMCVGFEPAAEYSDMATRCERDPVDGKFKYYPTQKKDVDPVVIA